MSSHEKHVPIPPMPLFARAAATPATAVPCPPGGFVASSSRSTKSRPTRTAPARSGWLGSIPVSTMAMTTRGEPEVTSQAAGRLRPAYVGCDACGSDGTSA